MEHRWGIREKVDIPIRISTVYPSSIKFASLGNLSTSGAFVVASFGLRVLAHIAIELPGSSSNKSGPVAAYVARLTANGMGVAWCELAPDAIMQILADVGETRKRA